MGETYYVDTSIWRDYYEDRSDGIRPLGEFAFRFFSYCIESEIIILYSELVLEELGTAYNKNEIKKIMDIVSGLLEKVENPNEQQKLDAKRLKKKFNIPFADAMHAILARDNEAILVSRDRHFNELREVVVIKYPEEVT
jgi:predicted nucleic acid-binding protein